MTTSNRAEPKRWKLAPAAMFTTAMRNGSCRRSAAFDSDAVIAQVCHPHDAKLRARGRPMNPHPAMRIDFGMVQGTDLSRGSDIDMTYPGRKNGLDSQTARHIFSGQYVLKGNTLLKHLIEQLKDCVDLEFREVHEASLLLADPVVP